jgi:hypothetical protein
VLRRSCNECGNPPLGLRVAPSGSPAQATQSPLQKAGTGYHDQPHKQLVFVVRGTPPRLEAISFRNERSLATERTGVWKDDNQRFHV